MIIPLTTDFGYSEYVAQVKGVILSINKDAKVVDVSHSISPRNIREGAFVLYSALPYFPPAIHVAVVDPGVGSERRGIVAACDEAILVGPDNGLLIPAAKRLGLKQVREIANKDLCRSEISQTFQGRDIFGPVAAHLSAGTSLAEVGPQIGDWVDLTFGKWRESQDEIEGEVIYADRFGNLITNIPGDVVLTRGRFGESLNTRIGDKRLIAKFVGSYGFGREGRPLLTISSSGFLEISVRDGSAMEEFGAAAETPVSIRLARPSKGISK